MIQDTYPSANMGLHEKKNIAVKNKMIECFPISRIALFTTLIVTSPFTGFACQVMRWKDVFRQQFLMDYVLGWSRWYNIKIQVESRVVENWSYKNIIISCVFLNLSDFFYNRLTIWICCLVYCVWSFEKL